MENGIGRVVLLGVGTVAALATAFSASAVVLEPTASEAHVTATGGATAPRQQTVETRADKKALTVRARKAARTARTDHQAASRSERRAMAVRHPRRVARQMAAARYGWHARQFSCLSPLWQKESHWNHRASNRSSGAYGIPQALPGSKMAAKGADWRTNPVTQIAWGLSYVHGRYGSPCRAWAHSRATGWY